MKIYSVGTGPGRDNQLTPEAREVLEKADVLVGYTPYFDWITSLSEGKKIISNGMKQERQRAQAAFEEAEKGNQVAVISNGDSGVYGMASLLWDMKKETESSVEVEVVPGISAMFAAAAQMGAPLGHDFCSVSLSDLMTPWEVIEKRIIAAAQGDFVTAVYNPVSHGRFWQLMRLRDLFLEHRSPDTPVGIARHVSRPDESVGIVKLSELDTSMADMSSVIIIGNSQTVRYQDHLVTPRGYYRSSPLHDDGPGRQIMNESFRTILRHISTEGLTADHIWVALHCIHTTADYGMVDILDLTREVVPRLYDAFFGGEPPVIVTDVSMVKSGLRKAVIDKLGLTVKCYLEDERAARLAEEQGITRTQAGIRLAVEEHPGAVFAFGNAPTALMELVKLMRAGKASPAGVIAAPVGFVNVRESKFQMKYGCPDVPTAFVHGRKGGSNVAATILNAIFSWADAPAMRPGEGV
ncbi:MAG: precorrin-3B C(17)-methyltransferase [Marinilabilia sp.]